MTDGTNISGKILTADADGNATWQDLLPYLPENQDIEDVLNMGQDTGANNIVNVNQIGIGVTNPGTCKLYINGEAYTLGSWGTSDRKFKIEYRQPYLFF